MGCEGWGLTISTEKFTFNALAKHIVIIGSDDWRNRVHESTCGKYLVVEGELFTFVLALEAQSISLFKATVRNNKEQVWSEENPIYKSSTLHINGSNRKHYYLQYPFVRDEQFWETFRVYEELRLAQISDAKNA